MVLLFFALAFECQYTSVDFNPGDVWYEIARLPNSFQIDSDSGNATSTMINDGNITVLKVGRRLKWKLFLSKANGSIPQPNSEIVHFVDRSGEFAISKRITLKTEPANLLQIRFGGAKQDGKYRIVRTDFMSYSAVLGCRIKDVKPYSEYTEHSLLIILQHLSVHAETAWILGCNKTLEELIFDSSTEELKNLKSKSPNFELLSSSNAQHSFETS